jgi:hypothetical protein
MLGAILPQGANLSKANFPLIFDLEKEAGNPEKSSRVNVKRDK